VNEQQLNQLEKDSGVKLPEHYRAILMSYPQDLIDLADVYPMKKGPPQRVGPETVELYREESYLRHANVEQNEYRLEIFPSSFFIIGESGCGDYYAIDCNADNSAVFMSGCHNVTMERQEAYYDLKRRHTLPEPDFHERVANSLDDFIADIRKTRKDAREHPIETESEFYRKQRFNAALAEAEEAFRSKDYSRVVRLLAPFQQQLPKAQAAKLSFAVKRQ
jgi:hypothetical protein